MAEKTVLISQQSSKPIRILKWKVSKGNSMSIGRVILTYHLDGVDKKEQRKLKSTHAGTVHQLIAQEGAIVKMGDPLLELEPCIHPTVMKDMCAECGADLRKEDVATTASIPMVHSIPELKVNEELARKLGKADGDRLLKDRKLVLLVDLDQTLIHTTNDNIPPNIKDVYHFQLYGPNSPWYHTRLRPGTHQFLQNVSQMYELHICTFGARNYAHTITMFLDTDQRYFSNRILSRDECFDPTSKKANLKALFPCGDNMVCIIDDREDVWSHALNLIHVKPYHFFQHTGDINAPPGLDKHESDEKEGIDLTKIKVKSKNTKEKLNGRNADVNQTEETEKDLGEASKNVNSVGIVEVDGVENVDGDKNTEVIDEGVEEIKMNISGVTVTDETDMETQCASETKEESTVSSKEEANEDVNVKIEEINAENDSNSKRKSTNELAENTNVNVPSEADIKDNCSENSKIIKQSEASEIKNDCNSVDTDNGKRNGELRKVQENSPEKNECPKENSPEKNECPKENSPEKNECPKENSPEKNECPKENKITEETVATNHIKEEFIEVEDPDDYLLYLEDILRKIHKAFYEEFDKMESGQVPDLKSVIPIVRSRILQGRNLVFSGLVPTHIKLNQSKAYLVARSLGAKVTQDIGEDTTHLVAVRPGTAKVNAGRRRKSIKIVTPDWLWACAERWEHVNERVFPLNSKGSKNRHPPPHCSSPEHVPNYQEVPATRKRTPSGRFMDTINPLMSFSSADIADMDKEVEDILDDESDDTDDEDKNKKPLAVEPVINKEEESSSSEDSLTGEYPRGFKRTREKRKLEREEEQMEEEAESSADEFPSTKFRRGELLDSDLDIGNSNSEGSVEGPDEVDDGEWNMMGAALEREFLSNN